MFCRFETCGVFCRVAGRCCVLDATFSARRDREAARALAVELGAEVRFVETRCAPDVALAG